MQTKYKNVSVVIDPSGDNKFNYELTTKQAIIYAKTEDDAGRILEDLEARGLLIEK